MLTAPTGRPLSVLAEAAWERYGSRTTVAFEGGDWTSAQLGALACRLASGFASAGVRPGDRVVVCMANCPEVLATYHAAWRLGAAVTPVLFLLSEDELSYVIRDSGAALAVTTPEFLTKVEAAVAGSHARVVVTGAAPPGWALSFDELASGPEAPLTRVDPTGMAALLYTGGTTGRSKGVMLSHDALSAAGWSAVAANEHSELDVSLLPLPIAHAFGLLISMTSLHAVHPNRTVLMRWFEPTRWLELAVAERVRTGAVVPSMLRLLTERPLEDYDLSALARLSSGGAPLPRELHAEWARRVAHVEIIEGYGCTETAALTTTTPTGRGRVGSVGLPAPGVEIRIEALGGSPVPVGTDGEICVRTHSIMTGYWHAPEATAAALSSGGPPGNEAVGAGGGWFHTGDIGHLDPDGYLYLVDRTKDLIIRGGFNVYPRDVEEVLLSHPDVADCAVVGRPEPAHGEEIVAFVRLRPGGSADAAALREYGRAHLSAVKYPREVRIVDALPLTSVGKLDRKALRNLLTRRMDERLDRLRAE